MSPYDSTTVPAQIARKQADLPTQFPGRFLLRLSEPFAIQRGMKRKLGQMYPRTVWQVRVRCTLCEREYALDLRKWTEAGPKRCSDCSRKRDTAEKPAPAPRAPRRKPVKPLMPILCYGADVERPAPPPRTGYDAELFHCGKLQMKLARGACADRWKKWSATSTAKRLVTATHCACRGCELGAVHSRGEQGPPATTIEIGRRDKRTG